jgi:hypothetical protein
MTLHPIPLNFLYVQYMRNILFYFLSVILQYIRVRFQHREETFLHIFYRVFENCFFFHEGQPRNGQQFPFAL